ncbi:pentatricopeptide repeat-containing protein [Tanacetum coccineum]
MPQRTLTAFNYMIAGYTKNGQVGQSLNLFRRLVLCGERPDGYSFSMVLKSVDLRNWYKDWEESGELVSEESFDFIDEKDVVCSTSMISGYMREGCVEDAEEVFEKTGEKDVVVFNAMIEGYTFEVGQQIEDARAVFNGMKVKNVFSWTSMIDGYGKNGDPNEALALFGRMQNMYHEIFEIMEKDYSMKPHMEHYACMVDLLGRAGRLNEGFSFVMSMPEKPNSDVWAALLSSCRLHGDVEMANAGRWDRVSDIRELMKTRNISKNSGSSWIGTDDGLECLHAA